MKRYRNLISVIGFLICFFSLLSYTTLLVFPKNIRLGNLKKAFTFYKQPKNTIDVLFLGASTIENGISPLIMWEEFGFTSFNRATAGQWPITTYYLLLESLQYQNPKVVVIDRDNPIRSSLYHTNVNSTKKAVDPLRFSIIKLRLILEIVNHFENETMISYLFPLIRYHDRWKDINKSDFLFDRYDPYYGQYVVFHKRRSKIPDDFMEPVDEVLIPDDGVLLYHQKIIDLCDRQGIDLIYLDMPRIKKSTYTRYLATKKIADANNLIYINYALPELFEDVGFDIEKDFQNLNHLNMSGSIKVTRHFGSYLNDQFDLTDRRSSAVAEQWNKDYQILSGMMEEHNISQ